MSVPSIGFVGGTVGTKFGLVVLPCPLFTTLVLLAFIEILRERSHDLTYGTVGEFCTRSCSGASFDSSKSLSPSEIR